MTSQAAASAPARGPKAAALVAVIAFVSFLPALGAGYVYDDSLLIATNPAVQSWHGLISAFTGHFWQTEDLGTFGIGLTYYRPVVTLSFVLNWLGFAGAAWGFHLVNLLLHAGAAFLATRIALRWLGRPWLAVLVGALFAVHPTRSESVIWIAGRTDILMSIFGLLSVELLHRARQSGQKSTGFWGIACLGLALLCKEGSVVLPALLLADALRDEPDGLTPRTLRFLLGAVALCGAYLLLRSTILPVRYTHSAFLPAYGFMTVATYVERLFWPWPQTFFYRNLELGPSGVAYPWGIVGAGVVLALGYGLLLWRAYRRDRAAAACLASAVLLLAPVLNFFETGIYVSVSDHFLYLPLFLLLLGAARLFGSALERLPDRAVSLTTLAVVVVCFWPNSLRAKDFKDERALWSRELAIDPDNAVALDWMSGELARAGQPLEASALLARASAPAAQRRFLLAGKNANSGRHVRRVVLTAAITPDGDVDALGRFVEELESFDRGAPSGHVSQVAGLTLGRERGQALSLRDKSRRSIGALQAELATLTSRLGRNVDAKAFLARVDREHPEYLPNPLNFVLVQARVGDYAGAFESLERLEHAKRSVISLQHATLERLARRLAQSQAYAEAALNAPPERRATLRALAALEVGGILTACRELRAAYAAHPEQQELAQLYTQALVSARLDAEAARVVSHALGPEAATHVVASLKENLSPIQRDAPPAPDRDAWWQARSP